MVAALGGQNALEQANVLDSLGVPIAGHGQVLQVPGQWTVDLCQTARTGTHTQIILQETRFRLAGDIPEPVEDPQIVGRIARIAMQAGGVPDWPRGLDRQKHPLGE